MKITSLLVLLLLLPGVWARAQDKFDFYGYAESVLSAGMYEETVGAAQYFRLKADFRPQDSLRFHAELLWQGLYGSANPLAVFTREGLPVPDQALFPFEDFHTSLALDQAWGSALFGPVDLQAGIVPVGWGTGYFLNPTNRTAPFAVSLFSKEQTESVPAVLPALHLPLDFILTGYLAFRDRTRSGTAMLEEGNLQHLPFGVKLQWRSEWIDLSACFIREALAGTSWEEHYYAGYDASVFAGPFELYMEAAYRLPLGPTDGGRTPSFGEDLEICLGGNVLVPVLEVTVRMEYAHLGAGERLTDRYDWAGLAGARRGLLGEDYLFLMLEREFGAEVEAHAGGILNLNDLSFAVGAEVIWKPIENLELGLYGIFYYGEEASEMNGEFLIAPGVYADLTRPEIGARIKYYF
jgi:hypothetical protein